MAGRRGEVVENKRNTGRSQANLHLCKLKNKMLTAFSNKKFQSGNILEDLEMENVGIFYGHLVLSYGHLVYFVVVWYILRSFGKFYE
jgi:hypothetical protein